MLVTQQLDLDHSLPLRVNAASLGDRIVHARCNPGRWVTGFSGRAIPNALAV